MCRFWHLVFQPKIHLTLSATFERIWKRIQPYFWSLPLNRSQGIYGNKETVTDWQEVASVSVRKRGDAASQRSGALTHKHTVVLRRIQIPPNLHQVFLHLPPRPPLFCGFLFIMTSVFCCRSSELLCLSLWSCLLVQGDCFKTDDTTGYESWLHFCSTIKDFCHVIRNEKSLLLLFSPFFWKWRTCGWYTKSSVVTGS